MTEGASDELERFWELGEEFAGLRFSIEGPRVPEAILKRMGDPIPGQDGELARAELDRLYRAIGDWARRSAYEEV